MIVHFPRRRKHFPFFTAVPDSKCVDKLNIHGLTVSYALTIHHHISALVKSFRSFFALETISTHGLDGTALWDCTRATLVSQLNFRW